MLLNAKPEELVKYSEGQYDKEIFIQSVKSNWELTDKQIRMTFLIADLAVKAEGVFSVSNEKFREMFEARFKMTLSRSTVIRFFQLLEELGLLSVHEARRKNRQQSANIFIINQKERNESDSEQILEPIETLDETPIETAVETLDDTHNIAFNNAFNKDLNIPLNKSVVNNLLTSKQDTIDNLILEYINKGLSKKVCFMVLNEVEQSQGINNFGGYFRRALENTLYKSQLKQGLIEIPVTEALPKSRIFYNWLEEREEMDSQEVVQLSNSPELPYWWSERQ